MLEALEGVHWPWRPSAGARAAGGAIDVLGPSLERNVVEWGDPGDGILFCNVGSESLWLSAQFGCCGGV